MPKINPLFLIVLILLLAGGAWYLWQKEASTLKTYRNDKFGFEFKYFDDPVYNLQASALGDWTRDVVPRLEKVCLIRNSVEYNTTTQGHNVSLCLTIYDVAVKNMSGFSSTRLSVNSLKDPIIDSEKQIKLDEQLTTLRIISVDDKPNRQVNNIYFERDNKIYIIIYSFGDNEIADNDTKRDADLFLQTFKFTK